MGIYKMVFVLYSNLYILMFLLLFEHAPKWVESPQEHLKSCQVQAATMENMPSPRNGGRGWDDAELVSEIVFWKRHNSPLRNIVLTNFQSLENKVDEG